MGVSFVGVVLMLYLRSVRGCFKGVIAYKFQKQNIKFPRSRQRAWKWRGFQQASRQFLAKFPKCSAIFLGDSTQVNYLLTIARGTEWPI